jgi:hypothetical protein
VIGQKEERGRGEEVYEARNRERRGKEENKKYNKKRIENNI